MRFHTTKKRVGIRSTVEPFHLTSEGQHIARCIYFIDLGTQARTFQGKESKVKQWSVGFEIIDEPLPSGKPNLLSKRYNDSASEKGTMFKDFRNWLGVTTEEFKELDFNELLGRELQVTIQHRKSDEKTYQDIVTIAAMLKGIVVADCATEPFIFSLDDCSAGMLNVYETMLTTYQKGLVAKSDEFPEWEHAVKHGGNEYAEASGGKVSTSPTRRDVDDAILAAAEEDCV
jgi:hypothetical protein